MPRPSGKFLRYMSPFALSASLSTTSTAKRCTPVLLAISSVCCTAGRTGPAAINSPKRTEAMQPRARICPPLRGPGSSGNRKIRELVGSESQRPTVGPNLGRHQALWPRPKPDQDRLPRPQLGDAVAAQRLHVHEDIGGPFATRQEAKPAQTVEPFDLGALKPTGRRYRHMGTRRWHLCRMHRRTVVHRYNPEGLQPLGALQHLAADPRTL